MKFIVDRIEEKLAVLEKDDMSHIEVPLTCLPDKVKEGNVLFYDGVSYCFDYESEYEKRQRIAEKQKSIFNKHKKGENI